MSLLRPTLMRAGRLPAIAPACFPSVYSCRQVTLGDSPWVLESSKRINDMIITRTMMAGHNKWSKIRHKKGANDVKKALLLGKASKALTVISQQCGGDRTDPRLQAALKHAKAVKLPKDRIEDAIAKGSGGGKGNEALFPLRFDAMMKFHGNHHESSGETDDASSNSVQVACVITALSDNRNRTTQSVRHLVTKHGGDFLPTDHLDFLFEKVGCLEVEAPPPVSEKETKDQENDWEDELLERALAAGATDVEADGRFFLVTTEDTELATVARELAVSNYEVVACEHRCVPRADYGDLVELVEGSPAHDALGSFLDLLEEDPDVERVFHNATTR